MLRAARETRGENARTALACQEPESIAGPGALSRIEILSAREIECRATLVRLLQPPPPRVSHAKHEKSFERAILARGSVPQDRYGRAGRQRHCARMLTIIIIINSNNNSNINAFDSGSLERLEYRAGLYCFIIIAIIITEPLDGAQCGKGLRRVGRAVVIGTKAGSTRAT